MLLLNKINVEYDQLHVLKDISFNVKKGEFISIIGPSGCGKSTLLRIIGRIEKPTEGTVAVADSVTDNKKKLEYGFVFQKSTLLSWRNVFDNITLPLEILGRPINVEVINRVISLVSLNGFEEYFPAELSGGMQQKVAIARALVYDPHLMIMDEPFSFIDDIQKYSLLDDLLKIWKETNKTFIYVTHSISEAVYLSDRIVVLSEIPAHIKVIMDVDIPRPRSKWVETLPQYNKYITCIRKLLKP